MIFNWPTNTVALGAIIYTVIESRRRRGIDPYADLEDVLTRLSKMTNWQIQDVTPQTRAKIHLQAQRQAAS
jgi:transposase